jgi:uncharacterized protein YyaL (SSP411 family)
MSQYQRTNQLINATSPYLLQHANNPVQWHQWSGVTLDKARDQDKLMLVSIGYSACHWCHVMAHECFEDDEVARIMNDHFICIKVDREERPDVDHFFMTAVQLMGIQGGWPLNIVALPDGQPFWGGTYFPKPQWLEALQKIHTHFIEEREKLTHHAHNLTMGIQQASLVSAEQEQKPDISEVINEAIEAWSQQWDMQLGGSQGKPKFPMPVTLAFLLHLHFNHPQQIISNFLNTTLQHMARGGICDQIGGGFARYSVDKYWKVPHFEKMLYDNAQLIELYTHAYAEFGHETYRDVVYETIGFVERELMSPESAFYSALDADSEGEEGTYYVWTEEELRDTFYKDFSLFADYYNINDAGYWENGNYILMRTQSDDSFAKKHDLTIEALREKVTEWKKRLHSIREKRARPGLDDKTLTSWNALMTRAIAEAYKIFGEHHFLELALKSAQFIHDELTTDEGGLFRTWKKNQPSVKGFMEDYATAISAFISLYEITGQQSWVHAATKMTDYAFSHFYDEETGYFRFAETDQKELPANHFETQDNVIPSSNAMMGHALFKMSLLTGKKHYREVSERMLLCILPNFRKYPWGFAHWGSLMLSIYKPSYEVVVAGPEPLETLRKMQTKFRPNIQWAPLLPGEGAELELLKGRIANEAATIYVCTDGACQLPVHTQGEAEKLLHDK